MLQNLLTQTSTFVPKHGEWIVDYIGFSANGWTQEAKSLARDVKQTGEFGKNWRAVDFRLLDLELVNEDLKRWTLTVNGKSSL